MNKKIKQYWEKLVFYAMMGLGGLELFVFFVALVAFGATIAIIPLSILYFIGWFFLKVLALIF